ncbi:hypothetical protein BH11BAC3_BH11BAC3_29390 [soil metagenome]
MKQTVFGILAVIILGISCKKDAPPTPAPVADRYLNSNNASSWNYELVNNITVTTSLYTLTSTNRDSTISSKPYHVFTNSGTTGNEYYNITGNEYYNFRSLPAAFGGSNVEVLYLKDNVAVGGTWFQAFSVTASGFPAVVTLANTIAEKGITKVINGVTYNDVIKVSTNITATISNIPLPAGALTTDIQTFYAPKYGLIQSINKIDVNFSGIMDHTDQQTNLKSSDLK